MHGGTRACGASGGGGCTPSVDLRWRGEPGARQGDQSGAGGWGVRRRHPGGKIKLETTPNEELRLLPSSSLSGGLGGLLLPWNQIRFCLGIQLPRTEVMVILHSKAERPLGGSWQVISSSCREKHGLVQPQFAHWQE